MDVLFLIKSIGLILSFIGYKLLVEDRLSLKSTYSWIFIFATISCTVYFSGFLNLFFLATYTIYFIGIVLFLFYIIKTKPTFNRFLQKINLLNTSFFIALITLFFSLIQTDFIHYDNFSHWGIIVKYLLSTDSLPTTLTDIIAFKTYPLGSTSFIYFINRILGYSEGLMLFAQALLILSCFYAFFGVIRDLKRFLLISIMGLFFSLMTLFNISIRINNLLVDFLLPLLALAVLSILYTYRNHLFKACVVTTPIMGLLTIVKNSGLFFYAICIVCLMYYAVKSFKKTQTKPFFKRFFASLATIAFTILPYIVWNLHTKMGLQGTLSKHTLSVENFQEVSSEKSAETIRLIIKHFFEAIFSFDSLSSRGIILFNFIMISSYLFAFIVLKKRWDTLKILLLLDISVVLYYAGNLAMFIYTMPTEEALVLAGLERYLSSMVLFFIGIVAFNITINTENSFHVQQGAKRDYKSFKSIRTKQLYQNTALICTALGLSFLFSEINGMNSMNQNYSTSIPGRVSSLVGDQMSLNTQDKFLVYAEDTDGQVTNFNLQYAAKYFLFSADVTGIASFTEEDLDSLDAYDYILIMDENLQLTSAIEQTDVEESSVGLFKIDDQKLTKLTSSNTIDLASR